MAGPLDVAFSGADLSVRDPLVALPRTPGERFGAEFAAAMAPDRYFNLTASRRGLWQESLDAYHRATGERLANPFDTTLEFGETTRTQEQKRRDIASAKIRALREQQSRESGFAEIPDPDLIDARIAQESRERRGTAARYVDTGNGLSAFAGGMAGETVTPHGVLSMFVPPTRLATLPAGATMRGFLGSVGREAWMQAKVGMGAQAGGELLDFLARAPLGTQQTGGEIVENIAGAGVGGALFGGGFRTLHEAWRRLRPEVREAAPSSVRDSAVTVERAVLDEGANPLPREAAPVHEEALARAQNDVLQGRSARVADYVATATEDAVDGPYLMRGVMPGGPPGVAVETGRVRGTGFDLPERSDVRPGTPAERLPDTDMDRYVVARNEAGEPVGVLRMTLADIAGKKLDPDAGVTVFVTPEMRRQGIASSLYAEAERQGYSIREVQGQGDLTPAGAALNRAMDEGYQKALDEARAAVAAKHPKFGGGLELRRSMEIEARARVYDAEARSEVDALAKEQDLPDFEHDQIARYYERREGETPRQAADRALVTHFDAEERRSVSDWNIGDDVLSHDWLKDDGTLSAADRGMLDVYTRRAFRQADDPDNLAEAFGGDRGGRAEPGGAAVADRNPPGATGREGAGQRGSLAEGRGADANRSEVVVPSREQVDAAIKANESPDAQKALDAQIAQMLEADPERTILISTDGENVRSVKIKDLLEEAKAGEKDAQTILSCAMGAPF